ncbi:hypothetical protein ID866_12069 [Astraeus odoratus]|nr:hypothetical protein ID866_12069 [Astraeus odoratus]
MSSPHCTLSPHECWLAKTKAPKECMEEEWHLISEVEKRAQEEAKHLACKEAAKRAERKVEEEHRVQEVVARAKEDTEREDAAWRAAEAVEERADAKRRALEEHLWEAAGQQSGMAVAPPWVAKPSGRMTVGGPSTSGWRASGVQDPCTRCCNKGTLCVLGTAKGKTMVCEACCYAKASCSWLKKMIREMQKQKQAQQLEETEDVKMVKVGEDNEDDKVWLHFVVPQHLMEDHQDTLGVLMTMLDKLSMDFLTFQQDSWGLRVAMLKVMEALANELQRLNNLKEEEMGKSKGKGKEKAKEEFRRSRMDDDGDMEMGGAGPLSLA